MIHFTAYMQWPATICTINFIIEKGIHLMGTFIILFVFIFWLVFSKQSGYINDVTTCKQDERGFKQYHKYNRIHFIPSLSRNHSSTIVLCYTMIYQCKTCLTSGLCLPGINHH